MRILVTGASGMLGATLCSLLENEHKVYGTGNSTFPEATKNYKNFDLNAENYNEIIEWSKPDIILLSGALTNGNYCAKNPSEAFYINGISVKKFIDATDQAVKILYISTDAVFPSTLHLAKELDCVGPENVYGKSKELGEFFTLMSDRSFCVIRTTIVGLNINSKKNGFVEWIINSSIAGEEIGLFDDVIFNPISIWDLGKEIMHIVTLDKFPDEILHVSGSEIITKHKFGISLLKGLNLSTSNIEKTVIASFKDRAKRCNDQTLDCSYYQKKYNRKLPNLKDTVNTIKHYYERDKTRE